MKELDEMFHVEIADDQMYAEVHCTEAFDPARLDDIEESTILEFLKKHKVTYGIDKDSIHTILNSKSKTVFPVIVAKGKPPIDGEDGKISYAFDVSTEIKRTEEWDFRDVMRIPAVQEGQKLVTIIRPTAGQDGMGVTGTVKKAKPGKAKRLLPGKNVYFKEDEQAFYAKVEGQFSVVGKYIHVQPVYEVNESLSMKNGNLDFIGTIVIRGDVPAGFTVKAQGDIKIYGMVEAAKIISKGSVYVAEGIAGQNKGSIQADENITIGYINQGNIFAGNNLYVENSIFHSDCIVKNEVYCQHGNIVGGSISAGKLIEAKDIGNRLSTKTELNFGIHKLNYEKEQKLIHTKEKLEDNLKKLILLGDKLKKQDLTKNPKLRISLLRQRNSYEKTKEQLEKINQVLDRLNTTIGSEHEAKLYVRNNLYQNVTVAFGKYKRTIEKDFHYVQVQLIHNEIVIEPLFD